MGSKMAKTKKNLNSIYEMQAEICAALASPVRIHILDLLSEGEMTSTELIEILKIPKANLSQHLSVLKDAGVINSRKEGIYQYLSLAIPKIKDACSLVRTILVEKIALEEKKTSALIKELKNSKIG